MENDKKIVFSGKNTINTIEKKINKNAILRRSH